MGFDLKEEEIKDLRSKYKGVQAEPEEILKTAEQIQDNYLPSSVAIGNLTTIDGAQSTKTRRPLSASVDLVTQEKTGLEQLGRDYESWTHMGAYFADVNDLEIGVIYSEQFPLWSFPDETFANSYKADIRNHNVVLAEPASNVASKVNRMLGGDVTKNSDAVDLASHLHWSIHSERSSINEIAMRISDTVDGPYDTAIEEVEEVMDVFNSTERKKLEDALTEFEKILSN